MENAIIPIEGGKSLVGAEAKREVDAIIQKASYSASRLMDIVEKCNMSKNISGKKYLEVEGWQMIAEFVNVRHPVEWVRPWKDDDGKLIGYEARVSLINADGVQIGAGESSCGFDAFPCRGKQGSEQHKAAKSAAQTWATSRAIRNQFSYVAKMAGYEPMPAEELDDAQPLPAQQAKPAPIHYKQALNDALKAYCGDSKKASNFLFELTKEWPEGGIRFVSSLTEVQAKELYEHFEREYLQAAPEAK